MIKLQEIAFPRYCRVVKHEFYTYDPENSYNEDDSATYLNEDLLQCWFPENEMIIDVGWYGDISENKGEFRIYMIQNGNWETPFSIRYSKSVEETKELLDSIMKYYGGTETQLQNNENKD